MLLDLGYWGAMIFIIELGKEPAHGVVLIDYKMHLKNNKRIKYLSSKISSNLKIHFGKVPSISLTVCFQQRN